VSEDESLSEALADPLETIKELRIEKAWLVKALERAEQDRIKQMDAYIERCVELVAEIERLKNPTGNSQTCPCEACENRRNAR
jgi:hypothetical protein